MAALYNRRLPFISVAVACLLSGMVGCRNRSQPSAVEVLTGLDAWSEASDGLTVRGVDPPSEASRYAANPECALVYAYEMDMQLTTSGTDQEFAIEIALGLLQRGHIVATPIESGWVFSNTTSEMWVTQNADRYSGPAPASHELEVIVSNNGRQIDGGEPTSYWLGAGAITGHTLMFPPLPESVSDEPVWVVDPAMSGQPLPSDGELDDVLQNSVAIAGWVEVEGDRAAVVTAQLQYVDSNVGEPWGEGEVATDVNTTVVLSEDGHVLWSHNVQTRSATIQDPEGALDVHQQTQTELRLVDACAGPTFPEFPETVLSPQEELFAAVLRLRDAVVATDNTTIENLLTPELVAAHGMPAIMQLIQGYVDEFTIEALLSEGFASEQGSSDDLFWAQYTCRNRRTPDGLLNCRVVGEQREDGMRISRIEVADYRTLPAMEAPSNGAAPPAARPATERFRLTADDAFAWSAQPEPDAEVPELPSVAP